MRLAGQQMRTRRFPRRMRRSIADLVVSRFTTLYGPPTTDDQDRFVDEYIAALNGTDPAVLKEAIDIVVKRQGIPAWPPVGACVEAVHEVAERRMNERRRRTPEQRADYQQPTPEEKARVAALLAGFKQKLSTSTSKRVVQPREDWQRATKAEWEDRMAASEVAQQLSIPRDLRRR